MTKPVYDLISGLDFIYSIDRHFAEFCQRLHSSESDLLQTAALLCSNRVFRGDIFLDIASLQDFNSLYADEEIENLTLPHPEKWLQELSISPVVGSPGEKKPLILSEDGCLYLYRYWKYEKTIYDRIECLRSQRYEYDENDAQKNISLLFDTAAAVTNFQALAALMSLQRGLTVISGGPGTGKTTTALKLLIVNIEEYRKKGIDPVIKLCAPTGKAAMRLTQSIAEGKNNIAYTDSSVISLIPDEAFTIHRLLGAGFLTTQFRYNEENKLDCDILLMDETSMIETSLMARLLSAVSTECRVVMLGDMHQLTSVGAGSVFSDICGNGRDFFYSEDFIRENAWLIKDDISESANDSPGNDFLVKLTTSYRFKSDSGIAALSSLILQGNSKEFLNVLHDKKYMDVEYYSINDTAAHEKLRGMFSAAMQSSENTEEMNDAVILSPLKKGPWGTEVINARISMKHKGKILYNHLFPVFEGLPVIMNANNYTFGLYNGDIGIVKNVDGIPSVKFSQKDKIIDLRNLSDYSPAYAMTIHRSQGSEYKNVFLIMPRCRKSLLTRELLYTALTRAKEKVIIFSEDDILSGAINDRVEPQTGDL